MILTNTVFNWFIGVVSIIQGRIGWEMPGDAIKLIKIVDAVHRLHLLLLLLFNLLSF